MKMKPHKTAPGVEKVDLDRHVAARIVDVFLRGKDVNHQINQLDFLAKETKGDAGFFYRAIFNACLVERTNINIQLEMMLGHEIARLKRSYAARLAKRKKS